MESELHFLKEKKRRFESRLNESVLPFWLKHGLDREHGGIYTGLSRTGDVIETDKSVWFQGRALWTFMNAYEMYGKREYLEAAKCILGFLEKHCFDIDGRMFFRVTEDGRAVIKRSRYFFSETFAIIGMSSYGRIVGDDSYRERAYSLYEFVEGVRNTPGVLIPKMNQDVEPSISFGPYMILINVLSELRKALNERECEINLRINTLIDEIKRYFIREDMAMVLETCAPDGSFMKDHFEGRLLNPGHAIELSWFLMNEGFSQKRDDLIELGRKIFDWEWDLGWDDECGGGIIQYRDALGLPLSEYHQDMKFWWPQCEAEIASLLAFSATGDKRYLDRFSIVDRYIEEKFVDTLYGEWFGYLHRDGTLATDIKGNMYKGPFHIPRMYMKCIEIIQNLI